MADTEEVLEEEVQYVWTHYFLTILNSFVFQTEYWILQSLDCLNVRFFIGIYSRFATVRPNGSENQSSFLVVMIRTLFKGS